MLQKEVGKDKQDEENGYIMVGWLLINIYQIYFCLQG